MALPDKLKPTALTSLTTGISNQTIANGASFTGSEIDNTSMRYSLMAVRFSNHRRVRFAYGH